MVSVLTLAKGGLLIGTVYLHIIIQYATGAYISNRIDLVLWAWTATLPSLFLNNYDFIRNTVYSMLCKSK